MSTKLDGGVWGVPVVLATWENEAGGSLDPRSSNLYNVEKSLLRKKEERKGEREGQRKEGRKE
jgi:hypothetical protein